MDVPKCFNETKKTNINPWPLKWSMTGRRNQLFFSDSYKLNKAYKCISLERHLQLSQLGEWQLILGFLWPKLQLKIWSRLTQNQWLGCAAFLTWAGTKTLSSNCRADQSCNKAPSSGLWSDPPRRTLRPCGHRPENRPPYRRILLVHVVCLSNINLRRDKCWTPPSSWETGEWRGRCALLKGVPSPPPQGGGRGWGVVGALKGQDGCAYLHEFLFPKWSPPVHSLDRGRRCIVQRCDMTFTQCFCQTGGGGGLRFKQEVGEFFASYIPSIESPTLFFSLADTALVPLSCLHRLSHLGLRHAGLWCDSPCWAALPPADQHSYVAGSPEQHCPCPPPLGRSHSLSVLQESIFKVILNFHTTLG